MSNALSIAAVTGVIKYLLENGLVSDAIATSVGDVLVTALPPDRITVGSDERAQLNLFLYQVTQNHNVDWVSQEFRKGYSRIIHNPSYTNPPLALDLHYLLTAYGPKDFQAEILLGSAMQMLHKSPIIASEMIENALINASETSTSSVFSQALASISVSVLAKQIGQIKISPEFFKMEETSKIWSALQTHYRPSVTYQASMVLIESLNEQAEDFYVIPLSQPNIEQVTVPAQPQQPIVVGSRLLIQGKWLQGEVTKIRFDRTEKMLPPSDVKETQISLSVPSDLQAGVHGIQVIHQTIPNAGQTHNVAESNVVAFILHPSITSASVAQVQASENDLRSAEIRLKFNPKVGNMQRVVLLLNQMSNGQAIAYSFTVTPRTEDSDTIIIPVTNIKPGIYLVQVQIDGAQSPLYKNQTGEYDSPQVNII
ncbi:Pvc16 family protein [Nostoc sp.]